MSAFGHFDDASREYVITNPQTPVKWINYIGNRSFGGFVDQTGGALLCQGDPALNRITKYISQLPDADFKGESLYVRVKTPDGYAVFSAFFTPCLVPYERYECRVGLGYSRIISQTWGIETDVTIFVPISAKCEVRDIKITNRSNRTVELDVIPVVEYTHFDALKQFTNSDWVPQTMQSECVVQDDDLKVLLQYAFMRKYHEVNYFSSSLPISSFETDRRIFLGKDAYGSWAFPLSLQDDELSNWEARRGDNIAALLHHLGRLAPGETRRVITQLGQEDSRELAVQAAGRFRQPQDLEAALTEQAIFWQMSLERQQVFTPDQDLNRMLNIYNPRQCWMTFNWSRDLSLYQLGFGGRGVGFRDSSQDVMGILAINPQAGKDLLKKLLQVQKMNGSAMHQFTLATMIATEGDSREREDRPHYYSDDHLWVVLAVCAYLKESGDFDFLEEVLPFYEKDHQEQPIEVASVWEHLRRAVDFTHQDRGVHGLPLLGFADWNDTINLPTGAESLLTANLYGKVLLEIIQLCQVHQDIAQAGIYQGWYDEMKRKVNEQAWDGDWYISYLDSDGTPLGSQQSPAGKIYAYGQAWPVISGFAEAERKQKALDGVFTHLNTPNGIKVSAPGFNGYDPAKGGITTYPPGAKENCGIFLHVNPWVVIAEALAGNGERAYAYYAQINPASKNNRVEEYECEVYVYPQNILGDEHPQFGLARNSWLSGTASWMYQAGIQYILGVRPNYQGLEIDPCIPVQWNGFKVRRWFRGASYEIEVVNPQHVNKGVTSVEVDGVVLKEKVVPAFGDGKTHTVLVKL